MILIYGGVAVDPSKVEEVTAAAVTFSAASRDEQDNIAYTLSWDVAEPNRIRMVEAWTTAEAHAAHTRQQHTIDWTTFISAAAIEAPAFVKHEAAVLD